MEVVVGLEEVGVAGHHVVAVDGLDAGGVGPAPRHPQVERVVGGEAVQTGVVGVGGMQAAGQAERAVLSVARFGRKPAARQLGERAVRAAHLRQVLADEGGPVGLGVGQGGGEGAQPAQQGRLVAPRGGVELVGVGQFQQALRRLDGVGLPGGVVGAEGQPRQVALRLVGDGERFGRGEGFDGAQGFVKLLEDGFVGGAQAGDGGGLEGFVEVGQQTGEAGGQFAGGDAALQVGGQLRQQDEIGDVVEGQAVGGGNFARGGAVLDGVEEGAGATEQVGFFVAGVGGLQGQHLGAGVAFEEGDGDFLRAVQLQQGGGGAFQRGEVGAQPTEAVEEELNVAARGFGGEVGRVLLLGRQQFAYGAGEQRGHDAAVAGDEVVLAVGSIGRGHDGQVFEVGLGQQGQGELGDFVEVVGGAVVAGVFGELVEVDGGHGRSRKGNTERRGGREGHGEQREAEGGGLRTSALLCSVYLWLLRASLCS